MSSSLSYMTEFCTFWLNAHCPFDALICPRVFVVYACVFISSKSFLSLCICGDQLEHFYSIHTLLFFYEEKRISWIGISILDLQRLKVWSHIHDSIPNSCPSCLNERPCITTQWFSSLAFLISLFFRVFLLIVEYFLKDFKLVHIFLSSCHCSNFYP